MVSARRSFEGMLPIAAMTRLRETLANTDGTVRFELDFGRDSLGTDYLDVHAEASLTLTCQRTLEPFAWPVAVHTRLGLIRLERDEAGEDDGHEQCVANARGGEAGRATRRKAPRARQALPAEDRPQAVAQRPGRQQRGECCERAGQQGPTADVHDPIPVETGTDGDDSSVFGREVGRRRVCPAAIEDRATGEDDACHGGTIRRGVDRCPAETGPGRPLSVGAGPPQS